MHRLITILLPFALLAAVPAAAQTMQVSPNGARASLPGPEAYFTGRVTVTPLFGASEHSAATTSQVEFTPGARSNWHTHPAGQTLIVTAGSGWVQQEGGEKVSIKPGDVIWTPPGVKHWHGGGVSSSMSHIAVAPMVEAKNVDWLEPVSDAQYR